MAQAILPARGETASEPMPINRPAEDVREISLASIEPPPFNPRRDFDEDELLALGESLAGDGVGLLQPIVVRPTKGRRFQVVAGERRFRASIAAGRKTITCTVRELDDRGAAEVQLVENFQRVDLNPVEIAVALRVLCEMGHTESSLAELLQTDESLIGARLSLLALPDEWQARVRRGKISELQAEYLVPWADRGQVLAEMAKLADDGGADMPLTQWKHRLTSTVLALSRSMDPADPDGPQFELSPETVARLDVVQLELSPGKSVKRAMCCGLWDERQDRADRPEPEPAGESSAADRSNGNGKPRAERREAIPQRPKSVVRYGEPVAPTAAETEAEWQRRVREWKAAFLRRLCREAIDAAHPSELPGLADALGVDVAERWRLRRDFLELFTGGRLEDLAGELGVDVSACTDDRERIAVLLACAPQRPPLAFSEATEPRPAA